MQRRITIQHHNGTTHIDTQIVDSRGHVTHSRSTQIMPESVANRLGPRRVPQDWLQSVIPAMNNQEIQEAFGFQLPEEMIDILTNMYPYNAVSAAEEEEIPVGKAQLKHVLTCRRFSKKKTSQFNEDSCCICWGAFKSNQKIGTLNCGHDFHYKCIKPWLEKQSQKCPKCKCNVQT